MCIYCDYCVYHFKSTELLPLYTLNIGLEINIIIIIIIIKRKVSDELTSPLLVQIAKTIQADVDDVVS